MSAEEQTDVIIVGGSPGAAPIVTIFDKPATIRVLARELTRIQREDETDT
jgi:hypothetical protein